MLDVVVIGGGPGGSTCAAALARKGLSVLVLEKARFPRFHLGESLLPWSLPVLEDIGVLPAVKERFLVKQGARFHDDATGRKDRFVFADAWKSEPSHAFQVPRDAFDELLLAHARASGADVREGWKAIELVRAGDRACGAVAEAPDGAKTTFDARFVVDASGRDALFAHESRATARIEGLDQTAIFAHFEQVPRPSGPEAGDIDIVLFRSDVSARPQWFWFIPFADGRTSVGAVVGREWIKTHAGRGPRDLFAAAVAESTTARELLAGAKMLWPEPQATADFSYRVRDLHGPGWLAIGDAGGFIDPLFSTGAHIAMTGGWRAADALAASLASSSDAPIAEWSRAVRAASETFISAVQAFYRGPLVDYLFVADKHVALRRSITSLLAGDVYGDAVWLRDVRKRMTEWAASSGRSDQVSF